MSECAGTLLAQSHPPDLAAELFAERVRQKPLLLRPTSPSAEDGRERRRMHRLRRKEYFLRRQRPRPLSARQQRESGLYRLREDGQTTTTTTTSYAVLRGLHQLWVEYMWELLGIRKPAPVATTTTTSDAAAAAAAAPPLQTVHLNPSAHGSKLVAADYHGARVRVVRARAVDRVGLEGIVARDTKFTFVVVTENDAVKTIPKEHSIFRFEIPLPAPAPASAPDTNAQPPPPPLVFELHGAQFENRPADRALKKFKWQNITYL
ncbi:hypothetical protein KEM52_000169 [Ascosphaera acerosa]|nr:hypothetical protein KEM52_000169 [Ascosphaera acerosa]